MIANTYARSVDSIRAPQDMVERAIIAAKRRAAAPPPHINARIAAAAAGLVLVSAASVSTYLYFGSGAQPPASGSSYPVKTAAQPTDSTAQPTEQKPQPTISETVSKTVSETVYPTNTQTEAAEPHAAGAPAKAGQPAAVVSATEAAKAEPTTISPTEAPQSIPQDVSEIDIDPGLLAKDGKVYFMIAAVALNHIDDPDAFSDDNLYYIETKWGRQYYHKFEPLQIFKDMEQSTKDEASPSGKDATYHYYYYNSQGTILYSGMMILHRDLDY